MQETTVTSDRLGSMLHFHIPVKPWWAAAGVIRLSKLPVQFERQNPLD